MSSGEPSLHCDPVQQLVCAHNSDPEAEPGSPAVPGASVLSGSSLDIGKLVGHFLEAQALSTDRSSTIDGGSTRTDANPSTEVSGTSVICAGGAGDQSPNNTLVIASHAASPPRQTLTSHERAQKCLNECRQDLEDENLEVEGVMMHGPRGPVFWGSWRGLEVAIGPIVFKVSWHITVDDVMQLSALCA
jgi:hypothetical protein